MPVSLFVDIDYTIRAYLYPMGLPLWVFKKDMEIWTGVPSNQQRWVCQGKEWHDDEIVLDRQWEHSTVRFQRRLKGGDPIGDAFGKVFDGMKMIFDKIWQGLKKIGEGIMWIIDKIKCAINILSNLWYCIFFYVAYLYFYVYYMFFYAAAFLFDLILTSATDDGSQMFFVPLLQSIVDILSHTVDLLTEAFPGLKHFVDIVGGCFSCP